MGKKKGSRRDEDDPFADLGEDVSQNNEKAAQESEITAEKEEDPTEAKAPYSLLFKRI